jgi:hypothetical protein
MTWPRTIQKCIFGFQTLVIGLGCGELVCGATQPVNRPDASDSRQADKRTEQATEQSRRASHETTRNDPPSSLFVCRFGNDTDEFGCGFAESFQDIDRAKLAERLPTPVVRQLPMFLAVLRRAGFFVFSQVAQVLEEFLLPVRTRPRCAAHRRLLSTPQRVLHPVSPRNSRCFLSDVFRFRRLNSSILYIGLSSPTSQSGKHGVPVGGFPRRSSLTDFQLAFGIF